MGNLETGIFRCHMDEVKKRLRFSFQNKRAVIFISAAGIAVRSIAEFVKDKLCDSPVIVISEDGRFVIPILSGHMGGANRLAEVIADRIGAFKAITTATDINGTFQLDNYAKYHQLHIVDREIIKKVASTHVGDDKNLSDEEIDSLIRKMINDEALIPKKYYLGIGCRRGKSFEEIEKAVNRFLSENKIDISFISAISSIDLKKDEMGIRQFADKSRLPFVIYSSEELLSLGDGFSSSEVVKEKIGIDNVCERAAVAAAVQFSERTSDKKNIIIEKTVYNGITLALAEGIWSGKEI
ncbi:cobalamin biosynthesis protein [Eubacterium sp.]|uniref:cobalt-precorrin 5A hydrolase n=1 Tax=Eubacterium sp. TaxID=142586 RepID=UPI00338E203F